jgi:hypothetical protein
MGVLTRIPQVGLENELLSFGRGSRCFSSSQFRFLKEVRNNV